MRGTGDDAADEEPRAPAPKLDALAPAPALEAPQDELERTRARVAELEADAREREERFHALVEGAFEGLTISIDGKIVEANARFAELTGYGREEVVGMTPFDLSVPEAAVRSLERIRRGDEAPYETIGRRKDGSTFACEVLGRNIVYQGRAARLTGFRDISARKREEAERKRLEEQMLYAQKFETLGVLAGGIAHEFNNLMLVVLGHAELSLGHLPVAAGANAAFREHLEQIKGAVQRARELTAQMLTYAGRAQPEFAALDAGTLVRETSELLAHSIGARARLRLELDPELPAIRADPTQLRQALTSLIANASEALSEADGEIVLRVRRVVLGVRELEQMSCEHALGPGEFVEIEIDDNGCGMDDETRARIFEPFFSTKWKGRGLGLAAVLGIVRAHHGAIGVNSERGRGSRFSLCLPLEQCSRPPEHERASTSEFRAKGVALLADDERMLRDVGAEILRSVGFEVLTARDGREALELFVAHKAEITVVLLDATMPRMGGLEALRAIRAHARETPVILMSGFHDAELSPLVGDPRAAFLAKPFEIGALLHKLAELL